jgi:hypothetical protein
MYNYLYDKDKCILKNCALEQKKAIEQIEQLSKQTSDILKDDSLSSKELKKQLSKVTDKIIKNKQKIEFLDCQINKCYKLIEKKVLSGVHDTIELMKNNKDIKVKHYTKQLDDYKKHGITSEKIIQYEQEVRKRTNRLLRKKST